MATITTKNSTPFRGNYKFKSLKKKGQKEKEKVISKKFCCIPNEFCFENQMYPKIFIYLFIF